MAESLVAPTVATGEEATLPGTALKTSRLAIAAAFAIVLATFAYYVYLIDAYPTIYWYDALHRYAYADDLTVDRWLPGSQIVVFVTRKLSDDALLTRLVLAAISCLSLLAVWAFTRYISTPIAGLVAILALCTNFVFASLATVPYGETLFIGCVLGALLLLDGRRSNAQFYAGTAFLIGACMTRYEGWFLAAILMVEQLYGYIRGDRDKRALLFCFAVGTPIALWLALGTSYTRDGESSILERMTFDHWFEFIRDYARLLRWQEVDPWILLAPVGFGLAWLKGTHRRMHLRVVLFSALTFTMIAVVEPFGGVNFRVTFVTLMFVHIYAAIALVMLCEIAVARLSTRITLARAGTIAWLLPLIAGVALVFYHTPRATDFVRLSSQESRFYGAELAGRWLRDQPHEDATIYALTDDILQLYAIAGMADTPVDRVLVDDAVQAGKPSRRTYVLAVYQRETGLSKNEKALLDALTGGGIVSLSIGPTRAWIIEP